MYCNSGILKRPPKIENDRLWWFTVLPFRRNFSSPKASVLLLNERVFKFGVRGKKTGSGATTLIKSEFLPNLRRIASDCVAGARPNVGRKADNG